MKHAARLCIRALSLLMLMNPLSPLAQEYVTPSQAPESYFVMGEYFGYFTDDSSRLGAQIRAAGDKYRIHFTFGGLAGDASWPMGGWNGGWTNLVTDLLTFGNGSMSISGTGVSATLNISGDPKTTPNTDKVIIGNIQSRPFTMHRVIRTSPTEGMPPVPKALVLFDGTLATMAKWSEAGGGEYVSEREALNRGAKSVDKFQSCFLHLEFLSGYMPFDENQARSNSGVYLQNRYEMQIIDSFGEKGREDNSKGALYGTVPALVNGTLPPLQNWETYDIYFTAAEFNNSGTKTKNAYFVSYLNGVKVQDGEMPEPGTGGAGEGPSAGSIFLQNHNGDPMWFRNIWVVENATDYPDMALMGRCWDGTSIYTHTNGTCPPPTVGIVQKPGEALKISDNGVLKLQGGVVQFQLNGATFNINGRKTSPAIP